MPGSHHAAHIEIEQLRQTRETEDKAPDVLTHHTSVGEFEASDPNAFLIDILRLGAPTGEIHASDVYLMSTKSGPGDKPSIMKERLQNLDVVLMHRRSIGITGEEDIARLERLLREKLQQHLDRQRHRAALGGDLVAHGGDSAIRQK